MTTSALIFDIFLTVLLLGVGGLMAVLYVRVQTLVRAETTLPTLSDQFVAAMQSAREALKSMGDIAHQKGGELDDKVFVAERTLQDLTYMIDRAEKVLARMDTHLGTAPAPQAPTPSHATPRPEVEPRGMASMSASGADVSAFGLPDRRRKTDKMAPDAVVMPGRQTNAGRRMSAQSTQEVAAKAPAFKPPTRQGSAAAYAAMGNPGAAADMQTPLSDVERDLRRALEETL